MKKSNITLIFFEIVVFLFILATTEKNSAARMFSDSLFFFGLGNLCIGLFIILMNYNYFKGIPYIIYYIRETYHHDKAERESLKNGEVYKKKKPVSLYEYENKNTKTYKFTFFLITGLVFLILSLVLA